MSKITVLLPTYNEKIEHLNSAISSIQNQTVKDIEILIIVDNPENEQIINTVNRYVKEDCRIRCIINECNIGLAESLNRGLDNITTEYVARMDADDIAEETRLSKQFKYLKEHPEISLIGTNAIQMSYDGIDLYNNPPIPTTSKLIAKIMRYGCIFTHPSLMARTDVLRKYRYRQLKYAQDYDMECRMLEAGEILGNIPDYEIHYRNADKVSDIKMALTYITTEIIGCCYRNYLLGETNIEDKINKKMECVDISSYACDIREAREFFCALNEDISAISLGFIYKNVKKNSVLRRQLFERIMCRLYKIIYS